MTRWHPEFHGWVAKHALSTKKRDWRVDKSRAKESKKAAKLKPGNSRLKFKNAAKDLGELQVRRKNNHLSALTRMAK